MLFRSETPPHDQDEGSKDAASEADLDHFIQRRRLDQYEQAVARQGYAYGVDVRRAQWLARSSLGNVAVRAVDRGWTRLSKDLSETRLDPASLRLDRVTLARLSQIRALLSAPTPALWSLRDSATAERESWMPVTPLGPARGGARWLVLDTLALAELDTHVQDFWLASGLAHLQCGHAVFYAAHRLAFRNMGGRSVQALRRFAKPWSRVMAFSSDRAGLLASETLESALAALEQVHAREAALDWLPKGPSLELRRHALREFERSVVVARVRAARAHLAAHGATHGGAEARVVAKIVGQDAKDAAAAASHQSDGSTQAIPKPAPPAPFVPADAWSVARCDQRLTERLRLL